MDGLENIPLVVTAQPISFSIPASEVGRQLPPREVTRDTIAAAYIQFILFCNPAYPHDTDPFPLNEVFHSPPTSNKKTFDTFEIYVQVKRLYDLEIKKWNQLALELGVEPASADDGGGSQRVQQYMVRLKRWMKFSHIDAFFHYLSGRSHEYYMNVPPVDDPHPSDGRDGVPTAEDLALRALDPRLRPKRGRKRLESSVEDLPPAQRHTFAHTPSSDDRRAAFATPTSAFPRSAFPTSAVTDPRGREPWSAVSTAHTNQFGLSATEPRSAFSAFAVDPRVDQIRTPIVAHRINKWAATTSPSPDMHSPSKQPGFTKPPPRPHSNLIGPPLSIPETIPRNNPDAPLSAVSAASTSSRRERQRLQLQVPAHTGGPVRLMTPPVPPPPPAILDSSVEVVMVDDPEDATQPTPVSTSEIENILAALKRSLAADLLRGDISGREKRLSGAEAKTLSISMLQRMGLGHDASKLTLSDLFSAAVQLGLAHALPLDKAMGAKLGFSASLQARKALKVRYARADEEGYEVLFESEAEAIGAVRPVFDVEWTLVSGAMRGEYSLRGLRLDDTPGEVEDVDREDETEMAKLHALEAASGLVMREVRESEDVDIYADRAGEEAERSNDVGRSGGTRRSGQEALDWREKYFELERLNKSMRNVLEQARDRMINVVLTL